MRADRLISILMCLQTEGRMTAMQLAQRLEVSERTIYRDIDALSGSGVPIYADAGVGGGFTLPAEYRTKIDGLTTPEIHALFVQAAGHPFQQLGMGQSLQSAGLKLFNALSQENRKDAEWIQQRIYLDTDSWRPHKESVEFIKEAQRAIWEERQAIFTYITRQGEEIVRTIHPYGLVAKAGLWFLIGEVDEQIRSFRLSRIRSFARTEEQFIRPDHFRLQPFWQEWIVQYEARRALYPVILEVALAGLPRLSQLMGEAVKQQAERGQQAESDQQDLPPGWLRLTIAFENEEAARSLILALGLQAKVINPIELRHSIRSLAAEIVQFYGGQDLLVGSKMDM